MNRYEILYIINPEIQNVEEVNNELHDIIKRDGKINKVTDWGVKELAYKIQHKSSGRYFILDVEANDIQIKEFESHIHNNPQTFLRIFTLNISTEKKYSDKMVDELDIKVVEGRTERRPRFSNDRRPRFVNNQNRDQQPRTSYNQTNEHKKEDNKK